MNDDLPEDVYQKPKYLKKTFKRPASVNNYAPNHAKSRG